MLHRKPRKGEKILYKAGIKVDGKFAEQVYIIMGSFRNYDDILNICTPEEYAKDGGHNKHTQIIWKHPEGPNPWLSFV